MDELTQNLYTIYDEKKTKIIPENIKEGVTILGVTGTLQEKVEEEYVLDVTNNTNISIEDTTLVIGGTE